MLSRILQMNLEQEFIAFNTSAQFLIKSRCEINESDEEVIAASK